MWSDSTTAVVETDHLYTVEMKWKLFQNAVLQTIALQKFALDKANNSESQLYNV